MHGAAVTREAPNLDAHPATIDTKEPTHDHATTTPPTPIASSPAISKRPEPPPPVNGGKTPPSTPGAATTPGNTPTHDAGHSSTGYSAEQPRRNGPPANNANRNGTTTEATPSSSGSISGPRPDDGRMVTDTGDTRPFPSHGPSGRLPKLTPENIIRRRIRQQSTFPAGTRDDYLARLDEQLKFRLRRDSKDVQDKLEPEAAGLLGHPHRLWGHSRP